MIKIRVALIIVCVLCLFFGLVYYVGWNGSLLWSKVAPDIPDGVYWSVYLFVALGYLLAMALHKVLPYRIYTWVKVIGSYGIGIFFYSVVLLPLADVIAWVLLRAGMSQDDVVTGVGYTIAALLFIIMAYGSRNACSPIVRRYDIQIDKKAGPLRELRLAVASDLHLGTVVGNRHLARLTDRIAALKPDLVLLPGDVLDDSIEPFVRDNMAETMRRLQAPLGVFAALGNHEYIGGHVAEYVERMRAIGIEVLVDRTVKVADGFYVAGRKDLAAERMAREKRLTPDELLADVDHSLPVLLMDHQPTKLGAAAGAGVDLMLSGHTHRGQMAPNHWITKRLFELDWGYKKVGNMHAIVSSGFGTWGPPIRLGSRSELLDIRIVFR